MYLYTVCGMVWCGTYNIHVYMSISAPLPHVLRIMIVNESAAAEWT